MSSHAATPNTEAAILARIIRSDEREVTPEIAQYWLSMKLPSGDEERVNELSAKALVGSLTKTEARELDSYLHIGSLLACNRRLAGISKMPIHTNREPTAFRDCPGASRSAM